MTVARRAAITMGSREVALDFGSAIVLHAPGRGARIVEQRHRRDRSDRAVVGPCGDRWIVARDGAVHDLDGRPYAAIDPSERVVAIGNRTFALRRRLGSALDLCTGQRIPSAPAEGLEAAFVTVRGIAVVRREGVAPPKYVFQTARHREELEAGGAIVAAHADEARLWLVVIDGRQLRVQAREQVYAR